MQEKKDCFAYKVSNYCSALVEMVCKRRSCSFYKTREQFEADVKRAEELNNKRRGEENDTKRSD